MSGYDGPSIYHKQLDRLNEYNKESTPSLSAKSQDDSSLSKKGTNHSQAPEESSSLHREFDRTLKQGANLPTSRPSRHKSLAKKPVPFQYNRSSTPFQVSRVPSPFYGFHPRPEKQTETVDYSLLKKYLKKEDRDCLLFEGFTEEASPDEESEKNVDAAQVTVIKKAQKKSGLSKSLSGIIQDEENSLLSKKRMTSSLFSTHHLDSTETTVE